MACLYSCLHLLPTITSHGKFEAEGVGHLGFLTKKGAQHILDGSDRLKKLLLLEMHTRQVACSWDGQPTNYGYSLVCHTFRSTTTLLNLDQKPPVLFMYWSSKRSNTPSCFPIFNFSYYMTTKACNRVDSCYNHVQVNIIEISLN